MYKKIGIANSMLRHYYPAESDFAWSPWEPFWVLDCRSRLSSRKHIVAPTHGLRTSAKISQLLYEFSFNY